jgi:hypothetical protein
MAGADMNVRLAAALVGFIGGAFVTVTVLVISLPRDDRPNLLQQLRTESDHAIGARWREAVTRAEFYAPAPPPLFPQVKPADPVMWDWVDHAVIHGQHRVAVWSYDAGTAYAVSSTSQVFSTCSILPDVSTMSGMQVDVNTFR